MSADVVIANFLRIAHEDLEGAKLLAKANNRNAVYLCEQAAEKIIRAVLTSEGKHAGIKHDLDAMVEEVPDENPLNIADLEAALNETTKRFGVDLTKPNTPATDPGAIRS